MRGVYMVAAELASLGLIVSPTSRSAAGADLLVTDEDCSNAYSVQVKTNAKAAHFWLVGVRAEKISSPSHVYVFVNIRPRTKVHEYYIVPSRVVAKKMRVEERRQSTWYVFFRKDAERYRDRWALLGAPANRAMKRRGRTSNDSGTS